MRNQKQKKGISLIALIITIIVIVLLAAIVVNIAITTPQSANLARFMQDMGELQQEVTLSFSDRYVTLATQNNGVVNEATIYEDIAKGSQVSSVTYSESKTFAEMGITGTTAWKIQDTTKLDNVILPTNYNSSNEYYITDTGIVFLKDGYVNGNKIYYTASETLNNVGDGGNTPSVPATYNGVVPDGATVSLVSYSSLNGGLKNGVDDGMVCAVVSEGVELAPIPTGYSISSVSGENSISNGLVIKDESLNEFVWVPVPDINQMVRCERDGDLTIGNDLKCLNCGDNTKLVGNLWNWERNNGYDGFCSEKVTGVVTNILPYTYEGEPSILTGDSNGRGAPNQYDGISANLLKAGMTSGSTAIDFYNQLRNEFNSMIQSVVKYGGFYVGRYELGYDNGVVCKPGKDVLTSDDSTNGTWYGLYRAAKTFSTDSVVSSMIWGSQWDSIMHWMEDVEYETEIVADADWNYITQRYKYVYESIGKGNFDGYIYSTGQYNNSDVKNIYDMAGNAAEATLESTRDNQGREFRICRGGSFFDAWDLYNQTGVPAAGRFNIRPTDSDGSTTSRCVLYIK